MQNNSISTYEDKNSLYAYLYAFFIGADGFQKLTFPLENNFLQESHGRESSIKLKEKFEELDFFDGVKRIQFNNLFPNTKIHLCATLIHRLLFRRTRVHNKENQFLIGEGPNLITLSFGTEEFSMISG